MVTHITLSLQHPQITAAAAPLSSFLTREARRAAASARHITPRALCIESVAPHRIGIGIGIVRGTSSLHAPKVSRIA